MTSNFFKVNAADLERVRAEKLWQNDDKYFSRVRMSAAAAIKIMAHGQSGVNNGVSKHGKPVEVMGLLLGRPDIDEPNCVIVTDAQPLPIEGFETRVIADDESTINYMIELGEMNELTRKERFCGWYHTHPFDVDVQSNCFLSNTDVSTQLQWQRSEDPHGNPWFAIVIDPLRSIVTKKPEMKAFRVYSPNFNPPPHETPDGTVETNDKQRIEKWGACWNRYYELEITFFMSQLSQKTINILKNDIMWQRCFTTTVALDPDHQKAEEERLQKAIERISELKPRMASSMGFNSVISGSNFGSASQTKNTVVSQCMEVGSEECGCCAAQLLKRALFRRQPALAPLLLSPTTTTPSV